MFHVHGMSKGDWKKNVLVKEMLKLDWRRRTHGLHCKG